MIALALLLAATPPEVVAWVDDAPIAVDDVVRRIPPSPSGAATAADATAALGSLVDEALLARAARAAGLDRSPGLAEALERERRRAAADELVASDLTPEVGDAELDALAARSGQPAPGAADREKLRRFAAEQGRAHVLERATRALRTRAGARVDEAFLAGAAGDAEPAADRMARPVGWAGARSIAYREVAAELERLGAAGGHGRGGRVKIELAWALVDRALLEDEALRKGYAVREAVRRRLRAIESALLADAYVRQLRDGVAAPTAVEVEAAYRSRPEAFAVPAARRCAQIVTASREAAEAVAERLRKGEELADLARRFSVDPATRGRGGEVGEVTEARLDELARGGEGALVTAIRTTPPGTPSAPARSAGGWHLLRCGPLSPARRRALDEVREQLALELRERHREEVVAERVAALRRSARIRVDEVALAKSASRRAP